jgi:hypothetical protein
MSSGRRWLAQLAVLAALLPLGCGAGDDILSSFIPDIENQWGVQGNLTHSFSFFDVVKRSERAASYSGNEFRPGTALPSPLTGTYDGANVQFTVERPNGRVTFSGRFRDENTMEVTGGGQTLVLLKGQAQ